ncbi:NAD(P)-dependent oxidoreductase [Halomonas alimentaria]|uniref:Phage minor structural protein GP20 n=1 Tax=Halomonas alimentaria TaxID=147248 RepID=A0A7X4W5Z7_9GAMM|nr:NAD(P)-dependent oxidoreductase [Halomonas alimentaria]NAW35005.1 hypothetical protein [Halomonas alimentaria]
MAFELDDLKQILGDDVTEEQAQKLADAHQAALDEEVGGLKSKRDELLEAQKRLKSQLGEYSDIDVDKARKLQQVLEEDEEARLIAEGKADEVVNRRTKAMREEFESKLEQAQTQASALRDRALSDEIRREAAQAGVLPSAVDDILLRARSQFTVDEAGQLAARDGVLGKDGEPLGTGEWLNALKEQAPHLFPQPKGSGAPGSNGGGGAPTQWTSNMSAAEKVAYLKARG